MMDATIESKFIESLKSGIAPISIEEFIAELREIARNIDK